MWIVLTKEEYNEIMERLKPIETQLEEETKKIKKDLSEKVTKAWDTTFEKSGHYGIMTAVTDYKKNLKTLLDQP
jgi:hypothetical protein